MTIYVFSRDVSEKPVENHFVIQAVLIVIVSVAMLYTGQTVGSLFQAYNLPYAEWTGFIVGAALIFGPFALLYKRYEAFYNGS